MKAHYFPLKAKYDKAKFTSAFFKKHSDYKIIMKSVVARKHWPTIMFDKAEIERYL